MGWAHNCVLTGSGGVECWGLNGVGELGDGTTDDSWTPVGVSGLASGVVAISAGSVHTCALLSGGTVECWGDNESGQLGRSTPSFSTVPLPVPDLSNVAAISAGAGHTCALTSSGGVKCWGSNGFGQLGNGTTTDSVSPVDVVGLASGAAAVDAGPSHTCAIASGGAAKCWGVNWDGELGNGTTTDSSIPVPVTGLQAGVVDISAGGSHTCALLAGGSARCWGANPVGELGDGTATRRLTPATVVAQPVFAYVALTVPHDPLDVAPFTVTARAEDALMNTISNYNASATWSDLSGKLSPLSPSSFVNGVSTTSATIPIPFTNDRIAVTTGGITGQSSLFNVLPPPARIVVSVSAATVGVYFTVKAVAFDANGVKVSTYQAPATWSDLSGQLTPASPANFVNGVSMTSAVISFPYKGDRITVTSTGVSGTSATFPVVGPAVGITLRVATPVTAGSPFGVVAQAVDGAGNLVKSYKGAASWSDLSGKLSPAIPAAFANGTSTTSATVTIPYRADRITVSSGGLAGQSAYFNVLGPLKSIAVTVPGSVTHGVPFTVKAVARDAAGNTLSTYNASATWSSLSGGLSPAAPSTFGKGVSTTSATFSLPWTSNRITVTSGGVSGSSALFDVL